MKIGVPLTSFGSLCPPFVTAELLDALCIIFNITPATFFYTPQEFSGDDSLFTKIDKVIDEELEKLGFNLKEKIRR